MSKVAVLLEMERIQPNAFELHMTAMGASEESSLQVETLVQNLSGYGLEAIEDYAPVPLFSPHVVSAEGPVGFAAFASETTNPDVASASVVIVAEVDKSRLADLQARTDVRVWPNSRLTLLCDCGCRAELTATDLDEHPFDLATSAAGVDCRPYRLRLRVASYGSCWEFPARGTMASAARTSSWASLTRG